MADSYIKNHQPMMHHIYRHSSCILLHLLFALSLPARSEPQDLPAAVAPAKGKKPSSAAKRTTIPGAWRTYSFGEAFSLALPGKVREINDVATHISGAEIRRLPILGLEAELPRHSAKKSQEKGILRVEAVELPPDVLQNPYNRQDAIEIMAQRYLRRTSNGTLHAATVVFSGRMWRQLRFEGNDGRRMLCMVTFAGRTVVGIGATYRDSEQYIIDGFIDTFKSSADTVPIPF